MNHWIIAPVILPALLAPILAFVMRHDIVLARAFSAVGTVAMACIALGLALLAADGQTHVYQLGNWPGPFGIVLVLDRLSALMLLLTSVLALVVLIYAIGSGWDRRGRHFHALFHFQLMGVCGAFLTGDAFNLFVFFEVLLIASYGLMIHGGGAMRLRAGLQYVVMNLAGSALFLFALGTIYAVTGTLNIADLARIAREMPLEDAALLRVAAMLLMIVFAIKAALFPMQFWLPGAYSEAPAPVAALFAIMTKVGAYAILRFFTIIFGPDVASTGSMAADWLMPGALITLAIGAVGVLGARGLSRMLAFSVLASMGTLMIAIALFTPQAAAAAMYYMIHSTFAAAVLFLIGDQITRRRGQVGDALRVAPDISQSGLLACLFFAAAIAMAGMPPLSGFLGKLLVLDAARDAPDMVLIWAAILISSLVLVVGFARAGSVLFWKPAGLAALQGRPDRTPDRVPDPDPARWAFAAIFGALFVLAMLTVFAGPAMTYLDATAAQLFDPSGYVSAVLGRGLEGATQ
ncbi:MAG: multicomponent K+:H+ antiporter subunit D [Paracoccaceae bacterium]